MRFSSSAAKFPSTTISAAANRFSSAAKFTSATISNAAISIAVDKLSSVFIAINKFASVNEYESELCEYRYRREYEYQYRHDSAITLFTLFTSIANASFVAFWNFSFHSFTFITMLLHPNHIENLHLYAEPVCGIGTSQRLEKTDFESFTQRNFNEIFASVKCNVPGRPVRHSLSTFTLEAAARAYSTSLSASSNLVIASADDDFGPRLGQMSCV